MITELTKNGYGKPPFLSSMIHSIFLVVIRSEAVVLHPKFFEFQGPDFNCRTSDALSYKLYDKWRYDMVKHGIQYLNYHGILMETWLFRLFRSQLYTTGFSRVSPTAYPEGSGSLLDGRHSEPQPRATRCDWCATPLRLWLWGHGNW